MDWHCTITIGHLLGGLNALRFISHLQGQARSLIYRHDNELLDERHAEDNCDATIEQVEGVVVGEGCENGVDESNENEWQRKYNCEKKTLLSFLCMGNMEGHDQNQGDDSDVGDNEECCTGFVQIRGCITPG